VGSQTLVLSAGAAPVASTCSSPPTPASGCWGSAGVGSGSVGRGVGSSGAGSLGAGRSGAGVAAVGFGLCLMLVTDLMQQNQLCYYCDTLGVKILKH
jgi:hypothetical protein